MMNDPRRFVTACGCRDWPGSRLGDDLADWLAVVDLESLVTGDLERLGVQAQLVQDGGMEVGDVVAVLDGVETDLVGGTVNRAGLAAPPGPPGRPGGAGAQKKPAPRRRVSLRQYAKKAAAAAPAAESRPNSFPAAPRSAPLLPSTTFGDRFGEN